MVKGKIREKKDVLMVAEQSVEAYPTLFGEWKKPVRDDIDVRAPKSKLSLEDLIAIRNKIIKKV